MNLIFDLDDTLYDLMGPFELVHKKLYADKTDADCTVYKITRLFG